MTARHYFRVLDEELEAYLAVGWTYAGSDVFGLDTLSHAIEWAHDSEPVLPRLEHTSDHTSSTSLAPSPETLDETRSSLDTSDGDTE